jgi:hypothetical protein
MNERIQELLTQAGAVFTDVHAVSLLDDEIEKFAELIVAECISTLDQDDGATHHGELLREHFGVESA